MPRESRNLLCPCGNSSLAFQQPCIWLLFNLGIDIKHDAVYIKHIQYIRDEQNGH